MPVTPPAATRWSSMALLRRTVTRALARTLAPSLGLGTALVAASVVTVGPLPGGASAAQPHPVRASRVEVTPTPSVVGRLGGQRPATIRSGALTPAQPVHRNLAVVGATWARGALGTGDVVQVRVHRNGAWDAWQDMEREDDHAPDVDGPGGAEGRKVSREGTGAYVVDGDQTQVRVLSTAAVAPVVQVSVVDPGTSDADPGPGATAPGGAQAAAARPTIHTRKEWGADESMRQGDVGYGQAHIAFVHHTDGTNGYTSAQVPAIIRGIYDFHVNGRDWNDIGYNFLVDRFGRIWEGRYGGVDKAVIGAHTLNYNSWSFGVAALGDFTSATPPAAMLTAIERTIAWKFTLHGNPATGTVFARDKTFNRISGHRDGVSTSCPGQALYNRLPTIRSAVASMIGTLKRSGISRSLDSGSTPDLFTYPGTLNPPTVSGQVQRLASASPQPVVAGRAIGKGWNALDDIVLTPDFTGDGRADVIARDPAANNVRVYAGNGRGGFGTMVAHGGGWNVMTGLVAAGDRTGDGRADLLAVHKNGSLLLYAGDGRGWVSAGVVIGTGFGGVRTLTSAGDLTGDGHPDLLGIRSSDNTLVLWPGTASGGLGTARRWGSGWSALDSLTAGPDLDGDGHQGDLVARQRDGAMRTYYADAAGKLSRYNFWGAGWSALDHVTSGADWDGDGHADVIARVPADSTLRLYSGTGRRDFDTAPVAAGVQVGGMDLVRVVGDLDGDGRTDAIARGAGNGNLYALRGLSGGGFAAPGDPIGKGWQIFDLIEAAGDLSNDGVPDLIARTTGGELRMYTMTRSATFAWQIQLGLGWQVMSSVTAAGAVNGDFNGDVVALRRSDGAVLLYRGSGPGTLNDAVVAISGQTDLRRVMGVGDFNGDRKNDLLAEDNGGKLWLYAGDGSKGFSSFRQPVTAPAGATNVLG
ncbi:Repeat domain-containing protein [Pedococcus dokdonensis]|uniref:Repeat domain-containing protein n=1 Tax=Pedococcus dokdonensis TaxID=443156 RepID=A0A1H0RGD1_9MICO|nr:FG-GAP-like repeat-containing protein [Pedococcus dokdonensis]SDP28491.1 Repeat domain-containing protein [Pedococcus dokdonensis]